jgi:hypothetical protein
VPVAIRLDRDGKVVGTPRKSKTHRVFIAAADARADGYPITAEGLRILRDDPEQRAAFVNAATSFRGFLDHWQFLDQETGTVRTLGSGLWEAQEEYVRATEEHDWLYLLKARQLGETTLAVAFDAYVARFRTPSARVHCFSATEDASKQLLEAVVFGLEHLPPAMQVPMETTTRSARLDFGAGERALVRSYPSTRAASRGSTCSHLHLDEWSAMIDARKVMQNVTPSVAPNSTFHIVCTEVLGAESPTAAYYRRCIAGEGKHVAMFCSALAREGRDLEWLEGMRRSLPKAEMSREYPLTWQEALEAAGERMFAGEDIDIAISQPHRIFNTQAEYEAFYASLFRPKEGQKPRRRRYSAGIDIGIKQDASVLIVLDVTDELVDVVGYRYLKQPDVGSLTAAINQLHRDWPQAHISIETNAIGYAIFQSVAITDSKKHEWITTSQSKTRALGELQYLIEKYNFSFDARACQELDTELRGFRLPDTHIRQDTVMALAIAVASATHAQNPTGGRILKFKSYGLDIGAPPEPVLGPR